MSNALVLLKDRIGIQVSELETHMALIQGNIVKGQRSIDMLTDYIRQYSEKLVTMRPEVPIHDELLPLINGIELRAHNTFAARLMTALTAQVQQNEQNQRYLARAMENLQVLKTRHKALEHVLEKRMQMRRLQETRREQKETDEMANSRHVRLVRGKTMVGGVR
ncbi:flagellar export protein FliJ [Limnobacter sp.]|uniref:flagellar export protein FliJ n=1 Tax=Limnobacter sp. TaxID=2003368 RepID=UPI0035144D98